MAALITRSISPAHFWVAVKFNREELEVLQETLGLHLTAAGDVLDDKAATVITNVLRVIAESLNQSEEEQV